MKYFIHARNMQTSTALQRLVRFNFPEVRPDFYFGYLGDGPSINPSEWREAKAFGKKTLVFFAFPDSALKARDFFIATSLGELKEKLIQFIQSAPALQKEYEKIEAEYPFLKQIPKHTHH